MTDFADRVRIRDSEETRQRGLAGREGQVYGWTTPSVTRVAVIGSPADDYAVNVHFDELDESFWFAADLVEFVDHGAGTVITVAGPASPRLRRAGQDREWVRLANGEWEERPRSK